MLGQTRRSAAERWCHALLVVASLSLAAPAAIFLAAIIVAWFSRQREFRADAGAAQLMGRRQPMINALARLGGLQPGQLPKEMQAMGISGGGMRKWFSSHPPIAERIAALQQQQG